LASPESLTRSLSRRSADAFRDEQGRQNHLNGPTAQALMAKAPTLLASPPVIEPMDVLGAKLAA
jgi:quinol monooxygenase YgiN